MVELGPTIHDLRCGDAISRGWAAFADHDDEMRVGGQHDRYRILPPDSHRTRSGPAAIVGTHAGDGATRPGAVRDYGARCGVGRCVVEMRGAELATAWH